MARNFKLLESDAPLLAKLSKEQKDVILLSGTIDAIAKALNIPAGTVKSRRHRAINNLERLRAEAATV